MPKSDGTLLARSLNLSARRISFGGAGVWVCSARRRLKTSGGLFAEGFASAKPRTLQCPSPEYTPSGKLGQRENQIRTEAELFEFAPAAAGKPAPLGDLRIGNASTPSRGSGACLDRDYPCARYATCCGYVPAACPNGRLRPAYQSVRRRQATAFGVHGGPG